MTDDDMIVRLEAHGEYRVLRRFVPRPTYGQTASLDAALALFVDLETTGTDTKDVAWQAGLVLVQYHRQEGTMGCVFDRYHGLEDPGQPLPEHIKALTGMRDEQLRGRRFDDARIEAMVRSAHVVVAHSAEFDRPMAEKRFDCMARRPWACSIQDVPWAQSGYASTKLEFLGLKAGIFYEPHRADIDAEVAAYIMSQPLAGGRPAMWHLLQSARRQHYRIWALKTPYGARQLLKQRGYFWRDGTRHRHQAWCTETPELRSELEFLRSDVYRFSGIVVVDEIGPKDRYTDRCRASEIVDMRTLSSRPCEP